MKIVNCPKGGRVPEGYCKESCLNYEEKHYEKNCSAPKTKKAVYK